jgi:Flp pilus assembly pilin Flp
VPAGALGALALVSFGPVESQWLKEGSVGPAGVVRTRIHLVAYQEKIMKAMKNLFANLVRDEQGGEVLEYALIVGLIVVAAIAAITSVGGKVLARWTSLNSSM